MRRGYSSLWCCQDSHQFEQSGAVTGVRLPQKWVIVVPREGFMLFALFDQGCGITTNGSTNLQNPKAV
jgi:hypothetical protein